MRKSKIKAGDDLTDGLDVAIFVTEIMLLMGKNTSGRRAMTLQVGKKGRLYRWNMCLPDIHIHEPRIHIHVHIHWVAIHIHIHDLHIHIQIYSQDSDSCSCHIHAYAYSYSWKFMNLCT